jgi:hypothetical protein
VCGRFDHVVSTSCMVLDGFSNVAIEEQIFALKVEEDIGGLLISTVGVGRGEVEDFPNCCGTNGAILSKSIASMSHVNICLLATNSSISLYIGSLNLKDILLFL